MPTPLTAALNEIVATARAEHDRPAEVSVTLVRGDRTIVSVAAEAEHNAASTMKLPVLIAGYRRRDAGDLDLASAVPVHNDFASRADGRFALERADDSDDEPWELVGSTARLDWLCRRMIVRSSNLATDLVWEQVGVNAVEEVLELADATEVRVERAIGDYAARPAGYANVVTTRGLAALLVALNAGRLAGAPTTRELLDVLAANEMGTDVRGGLPPDVWVAHKNGWISDTVLDAALVRPDDADPFVLCVAISADWPNEDAHALIRRIAAEVWARRHQF